MKNNSLSKSFTRCAQSSSIVQLKFFLENLDDIKKYLTAEKVFFIDSNLEVNFKKTKMNKNFFKILDFFL